MTIEERDQYVQNLLSTQRDMITLNRASVMIRQVLPRASATICALEEEVTRRFRVIRDIRALLAQEELGGVNVG